MNLLLTTNVRIILSIVTAVVTLFVLWSHLKVRLRRPQYGVIGLVVLTATLHMLSGANDTILFINGVGYMGLLTVLYFAPLGRFARYRPLLYWVFIGYTGVTIVLYFVVHPWRMVAGSVDTVGWLTKAVEIVLIGLLLVDLIQSRHPQISPSVNSG